MKINKYKKNDVVYFTDRYFTPSAQHPRKGSGYEVLGRIIDASDDTVVKVEWDNGLEFTYYINGLIHKHRIRVFFRWIKDNIKLAFNEIKDELSTYRLYRRFKKGDLVCLKQSTGKISSCTIGRVDKKNYPQVIIHWNTCTINYSYESIIDIEHYTGLNPNKLFQQYKMKMS